MSSKIVPFCEVDLRSTQFKAKQISLDQMISTHRVFGRTNKLVRVSRSNESVILVHLIEKQHFLRKKIDFIIC